MAKWKTRDGREVDVADMADDHLVNTLRMLRRNGFVSTSTLNFYLFGPSPEGDGAQLAFDRELSELMNRKPLDVMSNMESEAEKRGLKI